MSRKNVKPSDHRLDKFVRVAGGHGAPAARQDAEALLRRAVMANLLWEGTAYQDGISIVDEISTLVPQVDPSTVAEIARSARVDQKLRHVPLLLARECARHPTHRRVVANLLPQIVRRPDELSEFMALYWADGKQPIASSVKKGLAAAFGTFNEYQLAKYDQKREVTLRDVMFMSHPAPRDDVQAQTFFGLANGCLQTPDTWEVELSGGADKRATFERLINEKKLGALAFLRNLRGMTQAGVSASVIRRGFAGLNTEWLLPLNFFAAAKAAPQYLPEIEQAMLASLGQGPKLAGTTHLIVDVSGSMVYSKISARSDFDRLDAAAAMAVLAREACEHVTVWATAGSDYARAHQTKMLSPYRGFALADHIKTSATALGGGGIFTRQCLEYVREQVGAEVGDRTIVFSDSQDCDFNDSVPKPFSPRNYIVDVSAHTRGVNYQGVWTAEVSGWSEHFLEYVAALEAGDLQ